MEILYHASNTKGIEKFSPAKSFHGSMKVYFSAKRENVLVYLSNAIKKFCEETNFHFDGEWHKWASYGFTNDGRVKIEEYYPNALKETFEGVAGYIYTVEKPEGVDAMKNIPFAYTLSQEIDVKDCEYIADAYLEIMRAESEGLIEVERYENLTEKKKDWIKRTIISEYTNAEAPDYKYFLENKFADIINEKEV